jgi:hypothetical protein
MLLNHETNPDNINFLKQQLSAIYPTHKEALLYQEILNKESTINAYKEKLLTTKDDAERKIIERRIEKIANNMPDEKNFLIYHPTQKTYSVSGVPNLVPELDYYKYYKILDEAVQERYLDHNSREYNFHLQVASAKQRLDKAPTEEQNNIRYELSSLAEFGRANGFSTSGPTEPITEEEIKNEKLEIVFNNKDAEIRDSIPKPEGEEIHHSNSKSSSSSSSSSSSGDKPITEEEIKLENVLNSKNAEIRDSLPKPEIHSDSEDKPIIPETPQDLPPESPQDLDFNPLFETTEFEPDDFDALIQQAELNHTEPPVFSLIKEAEKEVAFYKENLENAKSNPQIFSQGRVKIREMKHDLALRDLQ